MRTAGEVWGRAACPTAMYLLTCGVRRVTWSRCTLKLSPHIGPANPITARVARPSRLAPRLTRLYMLACAAVCSFTLQISSEVR